LSDSQIERRRITTRQRLVNTHAPLDSVVEQGQSGATPL